LQPQEAVSYAAVVLVAGTDVERWLDRKARAAGGVAAARGIGIDKRWRWRWPMSSAPGQSPGPWLLLSYRMPREPSTPRIAVWRKLKGLGVGQLGDGLVTLPADARTREQLEWVAEQITEGGGQAMLWLARPASVRQEQQIAADMAAARAAEYAKVCADARVARTGDAASRAATARRLRNELRRIGRRDFFPPPERETARAAVRALQQPAPAPRAVPEPSS
jgi:hypothetical protein